MELQIIQQRIYSIRGNRVMLDVDLANLYEVETRILKQAVRRNLERFPEDFMFQVDKHEKDELISNCDHLYQKLKFSSSNPFVFTEQGVAMLSSILKSKKAVQVNIAIIRAFVLLRQHLTDYKNLKVRISSLEEEMNIKFNDINQALNYLLQKDSQEKEQQARKRIGFKTEKEEE